VRTAFHDAVARFGGPGSRSNGRCLPVESEMLEPRLTPLSLFGRTVEPRPTHFASRERYGATPAQGAFALCVTLDSGMGAR
jgi:hypothetical protein